MKEETLNIIMQIIMYSGNARSLCMEAMQYTRELDFESASKCLKEADDSINEAHKIQTSLLFAEANNQPTEYSLLMVHAQDHFMNAQTVKDLSEEIVIMQKQIIELTK